MADSERKVSTWIVALGTLLGGLGGAAAVVSLIIDYNNPFAQSVLGSIDQQRYNARQIERQGQSEIEAEERAWAEAQQIGSSDAYASYVEMFPAGRHVASAVQRRSAALDGEAWASAQSLDSHDAYTIYMSTFPNGVHVDEARTRIADLVSAASGHTFSVDLLSEEVRRAVRSARDATSRAREATARARRGEEGYTWSHTGPGIEGSVRTCRGFNLLSQGAWRLGDVLLEGVLQSLERCDIVDIRGAYVGTITYSDGRRYEGEIRFGAGMGIVPMGLGAMWNETGQDVQAGRWNRLAVTPLNP